MGSSVSDERLDANTRQARPLDAAQLDAIVEAYTTADRACGRKPGPQPQQPERLLTPDERYAFFSVLAPELHSPAYDDEREILTRITKDNAQALDPASPTFELLTHANLTLCSLLGVPRQDVQDEIDAYRLHVAANKDKSHFIHNVHTNCDKPALPDQRRGYVPRDILLLFCGESPETKGKVQFSLDGKASVIRFTRPLGRRPDNALMTTALSISERYRRWTAEPQCAPAPVNELQWLSYMAAVSIGSTLCPALDMDLAPYLVDESDFLRHAAGRCFARNFKMDPEKTERREQMEQGGQR